MGTDIHGVFQRHDKATGEWHDVPSEYERNRHYQLFAVLAGVRNGYGFAGIATGEAVTPIAEPRGLPADFVMEDEAHPLVEGEKLETWMGDHSHSWLTGEEILSWAEKAPVVVKTGVLNRTEYEAWDGASKPPSYCGSIFSREVIQINDNAVEKAQTPNWTHIRCSWQSDLRAELAYFLDEVARLVAEHGNVRFVFGFDS